MMEYKIILNYFLLSFGWLIAFAFGVLVGRSRGIPFVKRHLGWAIGILEGDSPTQLSPLEGRKNPIFTARDVSDHLSDFVADPFILREGDTWYLFFESLNSYRNKGEIGLAVSKDGLRWKYKGTVIREAFHLSYPHVFKFRNKYYMVPESYQANGIFLYEAEDFPFKWRRIKLLVEGVYADPTVFEYGGKWWIMASDCPKTMNYTLSLFYADDLLGNWREHKLSPVVKESSHSGRMAGRIIPFDGKLIRYAQDCRGSYGSAVYAFAITRLSVDEYQEEILSAGPIITATGKSWNAHGMHHVDMIQLDNGKWRAFVDGNGENIFFGLRY